MSYSSIKEKIDSGKVVILDGGIGGELERNGASMDKGLWCGKCSVENPELVLKIHENYIKAGADVVTSNTYALTPISMKQYGYETNIKDWNVKSINIAKKAAKKTGKEVAIAGSVSTYGSFFKLGIKNLIPGFKEHIKILVDAGADLIILEAMSSQTKIVEALIECSQKINIPVWLSISCALDLKKNTLMHGYQESISNSEANFYDKFDEAINNFKKIHNGPILIAHSDIKITNQAVKSLKKFYNGTIGAYPNNGYFEKPNWKYVENLSPKNYLDEAKSWVKNGAQIIGGCCGVGFEEIRAISILKN